MLDTVIAFIPSAEMVIYFFTFYVPQVARIIKRGSADDLSNVSWITQIVANAAYVVWGLRYGTDIYVATCIFGIVCSSITLGIIVFFKHKNRSLFEKGGIR